MLDDGVFTASDVTRSNLSLLAREGAVIAERRVCEISELVMHAVSFSLELYASGMGIYEILSLVSDGLLSDSSTLPEKDSLALHLAYPSFLLSSDRAELARLYVERLREAGIKVDESALLSEHIADESITYVRNALADEAYDVFSQELNSPRVAYSKSFKEAADAVANGEFTYCLLPLEERGGARLSLVSELVFRRDLKINSVTPVFGFDGNADMKYALLSSHFTVPELLQDDDGYLEIRVKENGEPALAELLSVAGYYGISLYRISTERFDTDGEQSAYYNLVFKSVGRDFTELLVYLTLFSSAYVPIGMYKNLE